MNETTIERFLIGGVIVTFVAALAWYAVNNQIAANDVTEYPNDAITVTPLVPDDGNDTDLDTTGDASTDEAPTAESMPTATLTAEELALLMPPTMPAEVTEEPTATAEIIMAVPTELPPVEEPTAADADIDTPSIDMTPKEDASSDEATSAEASNTEENSNPPVTEPPPTAIPEPTATPTATPVPIELIRGEVRWSGEKRVLYDVVVDPGATLIIEPNTTVFMAPGTSFYIDGNVRALGSSTNPVRITSDGQAWGGMFVRAGADVILLGTLISRGGGTTTLIMAEQASVILREVQLNNNLGHIQLRDSAFTFESSTMRDNQLPYGAAISATYTYNNAFRIQSSRIGPNTQADGAPAVAVKMSGSDTQVAFDVNGSILTNQSGPNLQLESSADITGAIQCTAFVAGDVGVSVRSQSTQLPAISLFVRNNAFEQHRGVRRNAYEPHAGNSWRSLYGMTSNVAANAQGNWWDHASGPYDIKRYTTGRGELAGVNVDAANWLTVRPVCAPKP